MPSELLYVYADEDKKDKNVNADHTNGNIDLTNLEEVIVTAQKRAQNVDDVPIAITTISGEKLENIGPIDLTSLDGVAPNVILKRMSLFDHVGNFAIRGIAFQDPDPTADPKSTVVVDGVVHTRNSGVIIDMFDIERIEILRGPQGTLFGRNNIAGTINITTTRPTAIPSGKVKTTVGQRGAYRISTALNSGNLLEKSTLRAKISTYSRGYDGHVTNAFNGHTLGKKQVNALRGMVEYTAGNFDATLIAGKLDNDVDGVGLTNVIQDPGGLLLDDDLFLVKQDIDGFDKFGVDSVSLEVNYTTGLGIITVLADSRHQAYQNFADFDARVGFDPPGPVPNFIFHAGFDTVHDQQSLEIRFLDSHSEVIDYVCGIFYIQEDAEQHALQTLGPPFSQSIDIDGAFTPSMTMQNSKSWALFGHTDIHTTDRLTFILGGRTSQDEKSISLTSQSPAPPPPAPQRPRAPIILNQSNTWDEFTWKTGLQYRMSKEVMLYTTAATGYKAGGFNGRASLPQNVGPFEAEHVKTYEFGVKGYLLNNRLRIHTAAFVSNYENVVGLVDRRNVSPRRTEKVNENLGNANTNGLEVETTFVVNQNLHLTLGLGLLDAEWRSFNVDINNDGEVTDNTYLDLPNAPDQSLLAGLDFVIPVGQGNVTVHVDSRYQSDYNTWGLDNNPIFYRPSVTKVNGTLTYRPENERFSISVYGLNLTDKTVLDSTVPGPFPLSTFDTPRAFGVEAHLTF